MATSNKFLSVEQMRETRNVDRLLPSQPLQRQSFVGNESQFLASLESLMLQQQMAKSVEEKWDIRLKLGVTYASLGSEIGTLYFYQMLMRFGRVKTALELGTYIGVSTLFLAEAVGENGRVTTVEFGKEFHDIARENFIRNGYGDKIELKLGSAVDVLRDYAKNGTQFDFVLLDAAKDLYGKMFEDALACTKPGGILLVDDILMHGDTLNATPTSDKGAGVRELLDKSAKLSKGYSRAVLPIGNGLLMIHKHAA